MKRTNIQEKLSRAKEKSDGREKSLEEVFAILEQNQIERQTIQKNISGAFEKSSNSFDPDLLQDGNLFHIEQIKKICINYRLRFLDSKLFKGVIPKEAISKIRQLEKNHQTELKGFKVLAPSKMFKIKNFLKPTLPAGRQGRAEHRGILFD